MRIESPTIEQSEKIHESTDLITKNQSSFRKWMHTVLAAGTVFLVTSQMEMHHVRRATKCWKEAYQAKSTVGVDLALQEMHEALSQCVFHRSNESIGVSGDMIRDLEERKQRMPMYPDIPEVSSNFTFN